MGKLQIVTSWDDGHPLDFKIAELLEKYRLPGVFFVSLKKRKREVMSKNQMLELSRRFEIGAHTLNHVHLTKISPKEARKEIEGSKKAIEDIIGRQVTKFCYPYGEFNEQIGQMVKQVGFESARIVNWFRTDKNFDPFFQPTTIHFYPHPFWGNIGHCLRWGNWEGLRLYLKNGCPNDLVKLSKLFLAKANQENGIFHLWGHSWEIEENHLWGELEEVLQQLSQPKGDNLWENEEREYWNKEIYVVKKAKSIGRNHLAGNRNYPLEKNLFCKVRSQIKGKLLLEIGCGEARYVANLLNPNVYNYQYIGIDLSPNALKIAQKNIGSKKASFICRSMEEVPLNKTDCDVVLAIGAVHHAPSQEKLIRKLALSLTKDGLLLLNEPLKRPGVLGFIAQRVLKPIVREIGHEARLDEKKLLDEVKQNFKILFLKKEVSPLRTFLILFLWKPMEKSLSITKIVAAIDNLCINTLGKIFPVFDGGELYLVARKKVKIVP